VTPRPGLEVSRWGRISTPEGIAVTSGAALDLAAAPLATDDVGALLADACRRAGVTLIAHRRRSVHHREGRSVSHVFEARVEEAGRNRAVLLVAHVDARPLPKAARGPGRLAGPIAVWRFPDDPYLPGLPSAVDPSRVHALLSHPTTGEVTLRTRAYRPTRRAVVEVAEDGAPRWYLKVVSDRRAATLADRHRQLTAHVPVPRVVHVRPEQGVVAFEALPGRTLRRVLTTGEPAPAPDELLELSQRLAASGLRSSAAPRRFADPGRHVPLLSSLAPDLAGTVRRVADEAGRVAGPEAPVHGDLHPGQLLLQRGRITGLLDVDGAGTGLLAQDAGSLVAYVQVLGELHPEVRDGLESYAQAVADVYRPVVGRAELARATAGAWLALASTAHRSQEPDRTATLRRRIRRALTALET
jgi:hypothetical protein